MKESGGGRVEEGEEGRSERRVEEGEGRGGEWMEERWWKSVEVEGGWSGGGKTRQHLGKCLQ